MSGRIHRYKTRLVWTGNEGTGTSSYGAYSRNHEINTSDKPVLLGSSDPAFRGDPERWNPEELLLASLSACHQLWYLHLCASAGIVVTAYADAAEGEMQETADGGGHFTRVVLHPRVTLASGSDAERAKALHRAAHAKCFIARSVRFPVEHVPEISVED